eukprot:56164-Chlamydomonas_euryale.AAC.16
MELQQWTPHASARTKIGCSMHVAAFIDEFWLLRWYLQIVPVDSTCGFVLVAGRWTGNLHLQRHHPRIVHDANLKHRLTAWWPCQLSCSHSQQQRPSHAIPLLLAGPLLRPWPASAVYDGGDGDDGAPLHRRLHWCMMVMERPSTDGLAARADVFLFLRCTMRIFFAKRVSFSGTACCALAAAMSMRSSRCGSTT